MRKIKKVFVSVGVFFTGLVSKVFGFSSSDEPLVAPLYGVFEPPPGLKILKVALPIVFFIIGLVVLLSKKISKKIKIIVVSALVALGIIGFFAVNNYINNNYF